MYDGVIHRSRYFQPYPFCICARCIQVSSLANVGLVDSIHSSEMATYIVLTIALTSLFLSSSSVLTRVLVVLRMVIFSDCLSFFLLACPDFGGFAFCLDTIPAPIYISDDLS